MSLLPGKDGLLHISELKKLAPGKKRIDNVEDVAQVGQKILVEIKEVDSRGKHALMPVHDEAPVAEQAPAAEEAGEPVAAGAEA